MLSYSVDTFLLSCNIERHMRYQITALPQFYRMVFQNQLCWSSGCHASLLVTIATAGINITLCLVRQIVNRHLCFRNQYQMCAYFKGFIGNISLYLMTLKCRLQPNILLSDNKSKCSHGYLVAMVTTHVF